MNSQFSSYLITYNKGDKEPLQRLDSSKNIIQYIFVLPTVSACFLGILMFAYFSIRNTYVNGSSWSNGNSPQLESDLSKYFIIIIMAKQTMALHALSTHRWELGEVCVMK